MLIFRVFMLKLSQSLEFSQEVTSLVCVCSSAERLLPAVYSGPIRLRWHVFITTFMSNRHTFPLVDDPSLRALVSAKSRYYYATYITDLAAFIWRNFVWFGLASVVAFLGGNGKCECHSLKALVVWTAVHVWLSSPPPLMAVTLS